ncbi:hypothetical protein ACN6K9_000772 [Streptomyces sp. SAS_267]|jgi:hypothetical protein|uniref:hypothetical protein n=1 Tax=unclassified Streptomyces TaxID=2593676 RepID=UPI0036F6500E
MFWQCIEVVGASVLIVGGVATLGGGWLPARYRSSVRRPVMFGWAQLTMAAGLIIYLVSNSLTNTSHLDLAVKACGVAAWGSGLTLIDLADREPRRR